MGRWAVLMMCLACWPVQAQDGLSLPEAWAAARERAPQMQAVRAQVEASEAAWAVARQRPNPSLSVEAENFRGSGAYRGSALRETTATLEWPLELGGKRAARMALAGAGQALADSEARLTEAEVLADTTTAFIDLIAAQQRADLADERAQWAGQLLHAATVRVDAGKAAPLEVQRAQLEQMQAQQEADSARRQVQQARQQLQQWTGLDAHTLSTPWFEHTDTAPDEPETTSPTLARRQAELAAAEAGITQARRERIPDISLGFGLRRFEESGDTATVLSLTIPLPLRNTGSAQVRQARAEYARAQAVHSAAQQEHQRAIFAARMEIEDARAAATATSARETLALEAARIARIGYREGKLSQLDVIEAERSLSQTRSAAVDARAAFHLARNRLALLYGQRVPLYQE